MEVVFRSYHVTSSASKISIQHHSIGIDSECAVVNTITLAVGQALLLCLCCLCTERTVYILHQKTCGGPEIGQPQKLSVIQMKCKSCHTQSAVTAHQAAAQNLLFISIKWLIFLDALRISGYIKM